MEKHSLSCPGVLIFIRHETPKRPEAPRGGASSWQQCSLACGDLGSDSIDLLVYVVFYFQLNQVSFLFCTPSTRLIILLRDDLAKLHFSGCPNSCCLWIRPAKVTMTFCILAKGGGGGFLAIRCLTGRLFWDFLKLFFTPADVAAEPVMMFLSGGVSIIICKRHT